MRFKPFTIEELDDPKLKEGAANFEIIEASEGLSKSSNRPMMILKLSIDQEGIHQLLTDYISFDENMRWKLRHFGRAINMADRLMDGNLDPHMCVGKKGKLLIKTERTEQYGDQPKVRDYVPKDINKPTPINTVVVSTEIGSDDDIPF